jgi:hypothetical protein
MRFVLSEWFTTVIDISGPHMRLYTQSPKYIDTNLKSLHEYNNNAHTTLWRDITNFKAHNVLGPRINLAIDHLFALSKTYFILLLGLLLFFDDTNNLVIIKDSFK